MVTKVPQRIIASTGVTSGSYTNSNITVNETGQITSASSGTGGGASTDVPKISNLQVTNSTWTVLDDTAVDVLGGYIVLTGVNFVSGCLVYIGQTPATSVAFVSSTTVRVTVPAITAGTYPVYLVNPDGGVAIRVPGVTLSASPSWQTASSLADQYDATAISLQLLATDAASYAITSGSLPPGLTMNSSGLISGTVTGVAVDTTYTFTVVAVDAQLQDSPRTFTLTITVSDPYFKLTTLLLTGNSGANIVTDASTNNFPITVVGDSRASNFSPYLTGWSCYFDGTGDYLTVSNPGSLFSMGTGAFTFECWVYPTSNATQYLIDTRSGAGTTSWLTYIFSSGSIGWGTGSADLLFTGNPTVNSWNHIAYVRSGTGTNQAAMFLNGTRLGVTTDSTNYTTSPSSATIGARYSVEVLLVGYISNMRVVKGTALYTANFTPATTTLTAVANTSLLTCHANRLVDSSTNNFAITKNGDVQVTSFNPFNLTNTGTTGSMYFDGTGDYLTTPSNSITIGSNDFTIEAWFYATTITGIERGIVGIGPYDAGAEPSKLTIRLVSASSKINAWVRGMGTSIQSSTVVSLNTWYHVALVRSGTASNNVKLYVNGVLDGSSTSTTAVTQDQLVIGRTYTTLNDEHFIGYISNVRLVVGSAIYTAAFTPPTTSLTAIANTQLLTLQNRQPHNNHTFQDSSANNFLITRSGNTTQGTFSPFSQTGWGNYFNGSNAYLRAGTAANWAFLSNTTAAWTIEFWIYNTTSGSTTTLFDTSNSTTANIGLAIQKNSSERIDVQIYYGSAGNYIVNGTSTSTLTANTWNHVFISYNQSLASSNLVFYINGVSAGTANKTGNTPSSSNPFGALSIGTYGAGGGQFFTGYLSNVRISNVVRTPPSSVPTTPYTSDADTQLLTCQSNRFIDNSTVSTKTITVNGSPSVQAFSPYAPTATWSAAAYGGSGYFDGSGDVLTAPINTAFDIPGNFTIEFWFYDTGTTGVTKNLFGTGNNPGYLIYIKTTNQLAWVFQGVVEYVSSITVPLKEWVHIAVCRSGSSLAIFQNGTRVISVTNPTSGGNPSVPTIGSGCTGFISSFRFVKGTAVYDPTQTTLTVPTAPLTNITNTSLLLNFTNAGILDATGRNDLETVDNAQISTVQSRWGGSSMYFDGTGDYLFGKNNDLLSIASGDFTLEFWVYRNSLQPSTYPRILTIGAANYSALIFWLSSGSNILVDYSTSGSTWTSNSFGGATLSATTWTHLALVRSSGNLLLFKDGTQQSTSVSNSSFLLATPEIRVATLFSPADNYFAGYLQDLRITRGYARYTSNFTPPTGSLRLK